MPTGGSLTVVGTGIVVGVQLTPEARVAIETADELLHLANDPVAERWLATLHPRQTSLRSFYRPGPPRLELYSEMVEAMLAPVRAGRRVCAAFYGHPGVFVRPSHEAVRRARAEGYAARMLPAVSAEDCLFADLGVDPADAGCLSFEATEFLLRRRTPDLTVALVLWQVTVIGETHAVAGPRRDGLAVLADYLLEWYPPEHGVVLYEASPYPVARSSVEHVELGALRDAPLAGLSTLYVPPAARAEVDPAMAAKLGFAAR